MVDSVFMASARIFDLADADENALLLRKARDGGHVDVEQVSGTIGVNSKVYIGHYTRNETAYIGFSDKEDLTGRVFNTMPMINEATLSYSGFFHLLIKPVEIVSELGCSVALGNSSARFSIEVFINSTVAHTYGITERQRMLLKLNPLLRPVDMRENEDAGSVTR